MSISKRLRFQIFQRDGHCCYYCGKRPPLVTLEVDHRIPRVNGGTDHPNNLVTACWGCNRGKGPLVLDCRESEGWEYNYDSWEACLLDSNEAMASDSIDYYEELYPPKWMAERKLPEVVLDFDIHAAAAELPSADSVTTCTPEAVIRKAMVFNAL